MSLLDGIYHGGGNKHLREAEPPTQLKVHVNKFTNFLGSFRAKRRAISHRTTLELFMRTLVYLRVGFLGSVFFSLSAVGTKIIADPETRFQDYFLSFFFLILLRDRLCLELIIVSSNFQAMLFLQDKFLESVRQH